MERRRARRGPLTAAMEPVMPRMMRGLRLVAGVVLFICLFVWRESVCGCVSGGLEAAPGVNKWGQ